MWMIQAGLTDEASLQSLQSACCQPEVQILLAESFASLLSAAAPPDRWLCPFDALPILMLQLVTLGNSGVNYSGAEKQALGTRAVSNPTLTLAYVRNRCMIEGRSPKWAVAREISHKPVLKDWVLLKKVVRSGLEHATSWVQCPASAQGMQGQGTARERQQASTCQHFSTSESCWFAQTPFQGVATECVPRSAA